MVKNKLISFVVPIRDNPELLHMIVSSILNQTKNFVEIVVVDSSSKDFLEIDKQHIEMFNDEKIKYVIKQCDTFKNATEVGIKSATCPLTFLLFNKEQWRAKQEEKNGFLSFVDKLKGDKNETHIE